MAHNPAVNVRMKKKGPSLWKKVADKLGINILVVLMMIKGAIAPTIGIAIYQNSSVANRFSTIGYLIPIMSILTVPILPRARFIQNLLVTCFLVCFAAAISLFTMWCAVKARANTTHISKEPTSAGPVPGADVSPYNAAASVNMAVWFFFEVWLANTFRAFRPQYFLPCILFSIFINVTGTYGTQFATMAQAEALVRRLLETFFSGFGISAAVSLLILPFNSRQIVFMLMTQEIQGFKAVLDAHTKYMLSLPTRNWYVNNNGSNGPDSSKDSEFTSDRRVNPWPEADTLRETVGHVAEIQVKIQSELRYAKRELDWGKLEAKDFKPIYRSLKSILLPVLGMDSLTKVTDHIEMHGGWEAVKGHSKAHSLTEAELESLVENEKEQWNWIIDQLHNPIERLKRVMIEALDYALVTLEFAKAPKSSDKSDLEANKVPAEANMAAHLENMIEEFIEQRQAPLKQWCTLKGMDKSARQGSLDHSDYPLRQRHQSQLYLVLDLEYSFLLTAQAILSLVKYADSKVEDGTMLKKRLIVPGWRRIWKWFLAAISREDNNLDYQEYSNRSGTPTVHLHDAFQTQKDPEHLPAVTVWEKVTDKFRTIPALFGSPESAFGFRVATATMVIAVVCYLRNSQQFFIQQRLIWGSIMVAISMTQTAGSGMYGQFLRFGGTAVAMIASYIIWYIVDQHTAGVIVFLGITMFLYHYPMIKHPENPVIPMIGMVTVVLIVGYELQVKQIGIALSISNGQMYYPLYDLAPYRLAAVAGGVGVAFIFTYFPSVVTARRKLREDLGATLYLLGNYYVSAQQTVALRIRSAEGDLDDKNSRGRRLDKARAQVFAKELILLQGMKFHSSFLAWEPTFGGKFPRELYDKLINCTQNIVLFTTMICHVTEAFQDRATQSRSDSSITWMNDIKQLISSLQFTSQDITSLLSIIATAISTGRPLPPYLKAPETVQLGELLAHLDGDILSARNVGELGYAAFAVMQVSTTMLGVNLDGLLQETKKLVGEVDYGGEIFS